MSKAVSAQTQSLQECLELKTVPLVELTKYTEAVSMRRKDEVLDEQLVESVKKGLIMPIVVDQSGKVIDGWRRVTALLQLYKQTAERATVKVPVLVVKCGVDSPQVARFISLLTAKPITSVAECKAKLGTAIVHHTRFSVVEECPVCRAAILLSAVSDDPLVQKTARDCLRLVEYMITIGMIDTAAEDLKTLRSDATATVGKQVQELDQLWDKVKKTTQPVVEKLDRFVKEAVQPSLQGQARPQPAVRPTPPPSPPPPKAEQPAVRQPERPAEPNITETVQQTSEPAAEEEAQAEAPPEGLSYSDLLAFKQFVSAKADDIQSAVNKKHRLYNMLLGAGVSELLAKVVVYLFPHASIMGIMSVYNHVKHMAGAQKANELLASWIVDMLEGSEEVVLDRDTYNRVKEMAEVFNVPDFVLLREVVKRVYEKFLNSGTNDLAKFVESL